MSELRLRKTKLVLRDTNVCKLDDDGSVAARFPLGVIKDIRVEPKAEYGIPALFILFFGALAVVCKLYIPSPGWSWVAVLLCLGFVGLGLNGTSMNQLIIETKEGIVSYPFTDRLADVQAFAVSVKMLANARSPVGAWKFADGNTSIILDFERGPWEGTYKQILETGGKTVREFGSWTVYSGGVQMLILATDIPRHPRFGINTEYSIEYLDSNCIRIDGPDRSNLVLTRAPADLRVVFDEADVPEAAVNLSPDTDESNEPPSITSSDIASDPAS